LSFEIQELPDVIRVFVLTNLSKGTALKKTYLKRRIDRIYKHQTHLEMGDLDEALVEMVTEGLVTNHGETVQLTEKGSRLGNEWQKLLFKSEPILEFIAGVTDGSITALVVILSAFMAGLTIQTTTFASLLSLIAVAITNFSSFILGGTTEDLADIITFQNLINYSLSDIPDRVERNKSLLLVKEMFNLMNREINRANIFSATICGVTTFIAGIVPIMVYLMLPSPLDIIISLCILGGTIGFFLVRYRSRKTKVNWKISLIQTVIILTIAIVASLLLGGNL
jgi:uncharacterized membrane protein YfcA